MSFECPATGKPCPVSLNLDRIDGQVVKLDCSSRRNFNYLRMLFETQLGDGECRGDVELSANQYRQCGNSAVGAIVERGREEANWVHRDLASVDIVEV